MATPILKSKLRSPSAPNALTNPLLQSTSEYKSFRATQKILSTPISMGSVDTTASDGTPATYNPGGMDTAILRVYAAGSPLAPPGAPMWVAGGGQTQVKHTLGRIPIGYIPIRQPHTLNICDGDSAWDDTYIYFHTTDSASDVVVMIF